MNNIKMNNIILESVLNASRSFKSILRDIFEDKETQNGVKDMAIQIYKWIDYEYDIETKYNNINTTDKNDEISFLQDSQYQKFLQDNVDISTKRPNFSKVGRFVRQLLKDNDISFSDSDVEKFVNIFKSKYDFIYKLKDEYNIEIVYGNEIKKWYLESNYYKENGEEKGTLWNSCMRYKKCQNYLDIYTKNKNVVGLLILTKDNKLIARSLVWKVNPSTIFLDRIYTFNDSDKYLIEEWVKKDGFKDKKILLYDEDDYTDANISIPLNIKNIKEYPYLDSLYVLYVKIKDGVIDKNKGILRYDSDYKEGYVRFHLRETDGEADFAENKYRYSQYYDLYLKTDDAIFVRNISSTSKENGYIDRTYYKKEDVVHSKYLDDYLLKIDSIFLDSIKSYYFKDNIYNDPDFGNVPINSIKNVFYKLKDIYSKKDNFEIYKIFVKLNRQYESIYDTKRSIYIDNEMYDIKGEYFDNNLILEDNTLYSRKNLKNLSFNFVRIDKDSDNLEYEDLIIESGSIFNRGYYMLDMDYNSLKSKYGISKYSDTKYSMSIDDYLVNSKDQIKSIKSYNKVLNLLKGVADSYRIKILNYENSLDMKNPYYNIYNTIFESDNTLLLDISNSYLNDLNEDNILVNRFKSYQSGMYDDVNNDTIVRLFKTILVVSIVMEYNSEIMEWLNNNNLLNIYKLGKIDDEHERILRHVNSYLYNKDYISSGEWSDFITKYLSKKIKIFDVNPYTMLKLLYNKYDLSKLSDQIKEIWK